MMNSEEYFSDHGKMEIEQQIHILVNGSGKGIFNGHNPEIAGLIRHFFEYIAKRMTGKGFDGFAPIMKGGIFTICAFFSLKSNLFHFTFYSL